MKGLRLSEDEYASLLTGRAPKEAKPSKYRNVKKTWNGIEFQSTKECNRYIDLRAQASTGEIKALERQKEFELWVNDQLICSYVADFVYYRDGKYIVEDVKSKVTRKLPVYAIKKKLMLAVRGIEIQEV